MKSQNPGVRIVKLDYPLELSPGCRHIIPHRRYSYVSLLTAGDKKSGRVIHVQMSECVSTQTRQYEQSITKLLKVEVHGTVDVRKN